MRLGESLALLKREKSKLARLIALRKENLYVEKGRKTPFDPQKLSEEIIIKIEEIRKLKIRIQKTNLATSLQGSNSSLAEAILEVNDIRSILARLSTLFEDKREYSWRLRDKDTIEKVAQLDEKAIEEEMERLEEQKTCLDNVIQKTNWETELLI